MVHEKLHFDLVLFPFEHMDIKCGSESVGLWLKYSSEETDLGIIMNMKIWKNSSHFLARNGNACRWAW